jgi:hypothetical protein
VLERPVLLAPYNNRLRRAWVTVGPIFETFAEAIQGISEDDTAFADHGLTGAELRVKLDVFQDASRAFHYEVRRLVRGPMRLLRVAPLARVEASTEEGAAVPIIPDRPARSGRRVLSRRLRSAARTALGVGDRILQSVTGALTIAHPAAGAAGASVDELKGVMETVLGGVKRWFKGR